MKKRLLTFNFFSVKRFLSVNILFLLFFSASAQQQDWDYYFTNIDDKPASVGLNLALHDTAPLADKSFCFWIILPILQSDSLGFPLEKENETLNNIEDELEISLQNKSQLIYVGKSTTARKRQLYYYTRSIDSVDNYIETVFQNYPQYKYKLGHRFDEKWIVYFDFLYPSPLDLQLIYNNRIVEALAENGDNSGVSHHIDHWLNFEKKKDKNDFIKMLDGTNFIVEKDSVDKTQKTHLFFIQVSEENRTDLETIDNSVLQLFQIAVKLNGTYGGWETFVVKE